MEFNKGTNYSGVYFQSINHKPVVYTPQKSENSTNCKKQEDKYKSPLMMAGGLIAKNNIQNSPQTIQKNLKVSEILVNYFDKKTQKNPINEITKRIMPSLTLKRLRKMQALVRGFLVRRKVYPKLLAEHRICQFIYFSILDKTVIQLGTNVVLEVLTFNKYNENLDLYSSSQRIIVETANSILQRVIKSISKQIVQASINDISKRLLTREVGITNETVFQLNKVEELQAYTIFLKEIQKQKRAIAQQAIQQTIEDIRFEKELLSLMQSRMLPIFYQQIINETLEEYCYDQVAQQIIDNCIQESSQLISKQQFEQIVNPKEEKAMNEFQEKLLNMILAETILQQIAQEI